MFFARDQHHSCVIFEKQAPRAAACVDIVRTNCIFNDPRKLVDAYRDMLKSMVWFSCRKFIIMETKIIYLQGNNDNILKPHEICINFVQLNIQLNHNRLSCRELNLSS